MELFIANQFLHFEKNIIYKITHNIFTERRGGDIDEKIYINKE